MPGQAGWVFGADCTPVLMQSDPVLDQVVDVPFESCFGIGSIDLSQTFKVGIGGTLARVDVEIRRASGTGDLAVDVRKTIGGTPVGSNADALVNVVIPNASVPTDYEFVSVDVSSAQIPVAPGDVLAIVLRVPSGGSSASYCWNETTSSDYDSGSIFFRLASSLNWLGYPGDAGFRTYVMP